MEVFREFTFDSAHWLPHVPEDHKCRRVHGHTYRVTLHVTGGIKQPAGWVMDFADLKRIAGPVFDGLDHRLLNDIPGLENPTAENLAVWLWGKLRPALPGLSQVTVRENETSGCSYRGE
ncbi:MAG: 6-carboxytetrahydropterin synthase QueD [Phycisphaerales bacterium]|nr:6-carboxytetrahydropterin synthase QueD [Phycisphaerales bacterium]